MSLTGSRCVAPAPGQTCSGPLWPLFISPENRNYYLQIKADYPESNICVVTEYDDERTKAAAFKAVAFKAVACAYVLKEELHTLRSVLAPGG